MLLLSGCRVTNDIRRFDLPISAPASASIESRQPDHRQLVQRISFEQPIEPLPLPPEPKSLVEPAPAEPLPPLTLRTVAESVYWSFPALEAALRDMEIADGKQLAAQGEFDLKLKSEHYAAPLGFYQNYRQLAKLEQALYRGGGNVFGQYRIGDGSIQPWYGERETNEGGEWKVGFIQPLFRDRAIDQRRADLLQTTLRRQQVDPAVQSQLLDFTFIASDAYWSWVAAGRSYEVQRELLRVTVDRNQAFEERVKRQDLAPIELLQNRRLIASRETKLIEAERKLQQSAIKLSLFLRDEQGRPVLPAKSQLADFPDAAAPDSDQLDAQLAAANTLRPELRELDLQRQQAEVDLALGQNQLLPALNATVEASKDIGGPASKKGDKTPFEFEAGLLFDMPLQRSKAQGKMLEAQGKLNQLAAKRRFTADKIAVQVRDALNALTTSHDRIEKARENTRLAKELETAERNRFAAGDSDLLRVALQEGAAIEAQLLEIESLADYFKAAAALRAATAFDPLQTP